MRKNKLLNWLQKKGIVWHGKCSDCGSKEMDKIISIKQEKCSHENLIITIYTKELFKSNL